MSGGRYRGPRPGPYDNPEWRAFEHRVRTELVPKLDSCAYVMSLVPTVEGLDAKFAVELGVSIMLGKPIIVAVMPGVEVPAGLAKVAVATMEFDPEDNAGNAARLANLVLELRLTEGVDDDRRDGPDDACGSDAG